MAYEKKTWESRDKLSHDEFNRMEDGIESALAESPTGKVDSALANQAAEYSENSAYSVGDYCIYNNDLYICVEEVASPGESWTSYRWEQTSVTNELLKLIKNLDDSNSSVFDKVYPVGSIYMSLNDTSPENLFGGKWEQLSERFLLGAGDSYDSGDTGGESEVALEMTNLPSHTHSLPSHTHSLPSHTHSLPSHTHSFSASATTGSSGSHTHTVNYDSANTASGSARLYRPSGEEGSATFTNSSGSHTHSVSISGTTGSSSGTSGSTSGTSGSTSGTSGSTGNDIAHNNMPPYLVVYMWKRTS